MAEFVNTVGLQRHTHAKTSVFFVAVVDGSLKYHSNSQFFSVKGGDILAACPHLF